MVLSLLRQQKMEGAMGWEYVPIILLELQIFSSNLDPNCRQWQV